MNLLTDDWIPVRPQVSGTTRQISLQTLLCGNDHWELALPRDDMELAALQLLICLVQVLLPPKDKQQWAERIARPLPPATFADATQDYHDWFKLDHPEYPFMQVINVSGIDKNLDELLPGLQGATNTCFVNEPNLATGLCGGCAVIALFNRANNAPSFCGGIKAGLRGPTPVTTFGRLAIEGFNLRETVNFNLLTVDTIEKNYSVDSPIAKPNWVVVVKQTGIKNKIKQGEEVNQSNFSLARALFWQPAHIELISDSKPINSICTCCGLRVATYRAFKYEKFSYGYSGVWEHPHSPNALSVIEGHPETRHVRFNRSTPSWTQLSSYVVKSENDGEQQRPALVIRQAQDYISSLPQKYRRIFELIAGGYCNNQAAILERRHDVFTLTQGWESHTKEVHELIGRGLSYLRTLAYSLYLFSVGIEDADRKIKGVSLKYKAKKKTYYSLQEIGKTQFYRRSENLMIRSLADIDFNNPAPTFIMLDKELKQICESVFTELTSPYEHDLELFRTLAIARRSLQKRMNEIRIQQTNEEPA